ncbi:hypothetical protein [uncultured Paraglaciecola sp.]|uniref:hypothetical protein n=1 Tax=uncultured Paraglaciecola sp. TaxID=1765024 RepID=UPI002594C88D|nr:hypothetical protein [uncultured Paraglaciecola sp.]
MKINCSLLALVVISGHAFSDEETQNYLKEHSSYFIMDTQKSCFGPLSTGREQIPLTYNNHGDETPNNTYETEKLCIEAGGKLTVEEVRRQAIQDTLIVKEQTKEQDSNQKFFGINWGLGLAFTYVDNPIVTDVSILSNDDGGTISVNHQSQHRAIAMVESHYFRNCWFNLLFGECSASRSGDFGHGPFIAIGLIGEDGIDPLSTYGLGWMVGFKRDDKGNAWNIGFGYFVDSQAQKLRPNYSDGDQTSITDSTQLTYERDETGVMMMFSSTF